MKKQLADYNKTEVLSYLSYLERQYRKAMEVLTKHNPQQKDSQAIIAFAEKVFDEAESMVI